MFVLESFLASVVLWVNDVSLTLISKALLLLKKSKKDPQVEVVYENNHM